MQGQHRPSDNDVDRAADARRRSGDRTPRDGTESPSSQESAPGQPAVEHSHEDVDSGADARGRNGALTARDGSESAGSREGASRQAAAEGAPEGVDRRVDTRRRNGAGTPRDDGSEPVGSQERASEWPAVEDSHELLKRQNEELRVVRGELEAERKRFRELFEFAPYAYVVTDRRAVIRDVNVAAERLFAHRRDLLIAKPMRLFVPIEGTEDFYALLARLERTGRLDDVGVTLATRKPVHVSISAVVYPQTGMPIQEIRWQFRDVTERVEREGEIGRLNADLEERVRERTLELTRANAAKDEFLGMISHELKTPITVISGNAEALHRYGDALSAEQRAEALIDVRNEADRLQRIIDNLLVLARLEGGQEIGREPVRLDLLVRERIADHRVRFPKRSIDAELGGPELIDAAPVYVDQVLRNLISNAEKYSCPDGAILVSVQHTASEATVCVANDGDGVPEAELGQLFTPFFRSARTVNSAAGAGIGLAVCKRLVEAQGGRIWADRGDGSRMSFCFTLPTVEAPDS